MRSIILLTGLGLPLTAHAAGLADIGAGMVTGMWVDVCTTLPYCGMGATGVALLAGIVIRTVLWAIGAGAVVVILYAAAQIVTAAGNEERVSKARKTIFYALLGLFFAVLANLIVNYVFGLVAGIAGSI